MGFPQQAVFSESFAGREKSSDSGLFRADATFLIGASVAAFSMRAMGVPIAGIGVGEAHEIALITGLLVWHASSRPSWHLATAGMHSLLVATNATGLGELSGGPTVAIAVAAAAVHGVFALLHGAAARAGLRG